MSEDMIKELRKQREIREKAHTKAKGMIEGLRLTRLNDTDKNILTVLEFAIDISEKFGGIADSLAEGEIRLTQRLETLEKEVKQLRETIDTLMENR